MLLQGLHFGEVVVIQFDFFVNKVGAVNHDDGLDSMASGNIRLHLLL